MSTEPEPGPTTPDTPSGTHTLNNVTAPMPSVEHRSHKGLNNRAENSHQPTRQRERAMKGFRSVGGAQRFLSAFSGISPHFRPHRHLMTASDHRAEMTVRFAIWDQITGAAGRPTTA
ncbi:DDE-type integrase/transposase/recombinase [Streptomyces sp. NPDC087845]|uniref:DDE-type integrase/transposase/recombinase n=1 Tax=Streptomyces sp. NPDC087845 TaxID=3365806 RepID=UPI0038215579